MRPFIILIKMVKAPSKEDIEMCKDKIEKKLLNLDQECEVDAFVLCHNMPKPKYRNHPADIKF